MTYLVLIFHTEEPRLIQVLLNFYGRPFGYARWKINNSPVYTYIGRYTR